jgi:Na+(H+)/acetate symporter ActP
MKAELFGVRRSECTTLGWQQVPGLMIAGVLGSTMSVFSGGLNACATVVYTDILVNGFGMKFTDKRGLRMMKILTVCIAAISIGLGFAAAVC